LSSYFNKRIYPKAYSTGAIKLNTKYVDTNMQINELILIVVGIKCIFLLLIIYTYLYYNFFSKSTKTNVLEFKIHYIFRDSLNLSYYIFSDTVSSVLNPTFLFNTNASYFPTTYFTWSLFK